MSIKNTLLALGILGTMISCGNQGETKVSAVTTETVDTDSTALTQQGIITFENTVFDFGKVTEGAVVEHFFKFKNTGTAPVILTQVSASCGCTTPEFTKEPVLPGKEGEIKVIFNSLGQVGTQQKIVTVSSNAENRVTTVQIKGVVEK